MKFEFDRRDVPEGIDVEWRAHCVTDRQTDNGTWERVGVFVPAQTVEIATVPGPISAADVRMREAIAQKGSVADKRSVGIDS